MSRNIILGHLIPDGLKNGGELVLPVIYLYVLVLYDSCYITQFHMRTLDIISMLADKI